MRTIIEPGTWREEDRKVKWGSKYELVSRVAYLIGVPYSVFENEFEAPKMEIYEELQQNKSARIVRNLCIVRTSIERWFSKIKAKMHFEFKTIYSVPEYIPQDALTQLSVDGIILSRQPGKRLIEYSLELNRLICDRINNCKDIFPDWIKWEYIRDLFVMNNGFSERGIRAAGELYHKNMAYYPYKVYINWLPGDYGNILFHDKKFAKLLYQFHRDKFTDIDKVSNEDDFLVGNIQDFLVKAKKVVMVVDCENADPYRLCAMMKALDADAQEQISKIMLFGDANTADVWQILQSFTGVPIEYVNCNRIRPLKSLVDIEMTAITCREHYRENVDAFIVVASDSDYWGMITSLPDARFLVMIERDKCSRDLIDQLYQNHIFYGYIEDFDSGNQETIKALAITGEFERVLTGTLRADINCILGQVLKRTGIQIPVEDRQGFIKKYLSNIRLLVSDEGKLSVKIEMENATK